MMAITTSNSISVKARTLARERNGACQDSMNREDEDGQYRVAANTD